TRYNIDEVYEVVETLVRHECKITFNVFSSTVGYNGPLRHNDGSLAKTRKTMLDLLSRFSENVVFSPYNVVAHTHSLGLHALYSCPYPRMNPSTDLGLGRSFRQYRSDLSWDRSVACCVPDTDCDDCRHYASGSAVVTARLFRHVTDPDTFKGWLDYADTYLAVWVMDYEKGENLSSRMVSPPGFNLP
ncbi:MAG: radical SAM protein, partial [Spirochaetes bacterium]|nr:radical SAM protein [Spirochaetota bacterium]